MMDSLVGSGDLGNDTKVRPTKNRGVSYGSTHLGTGPGLKAVQFGCKTECIAFLTPGQHTIALTARNLAATNSTVAQEVTQRELIIVEWNA